MELQLTSSSRSHLTFLFCFGNFHIPHLGSPSRAMNPEGSFCHRAGGRAFSGVPSEPRMVYGRYLPCTQSTLLDPYIPYGLCTHQGSPMGFSENLPQISPRGLLSLLLQRFLLPSFPGLLQCILGPVLLACCFVPHTSFAGALLTLASSMTLLLGIVVASLLLHTARTCQWQLLNLPQ